MTGLRRLTPETIRAPFARYVHGIEVPAGARLLFTSGQLGIAPDDHVPEDAAAQAEICFRAIGDVLAAAGMGPQDIVRINAFVTDRAHMKPYMEVRDRFMNGHPPASTLVVVSGFTRPDFKVEVEVTAAKVD